MHQVIGIGIISFRISLMAYVISCLVLLNLAWSAPKSSLRDFIMSLQESEKITALFKQKIVSTEFKKIEKLNQNKAQQLLSLMKESHAFSRGEIEDEKVLNGMLVWLQYSILQVRNNPSLRAEIFPPWLLFAADLSYEEASLIALKFSHLIRSLIFDEAEGLLAFGDEKDIWIKSVRAPWPIDRVLMAEAKKHLKPASLLLIEKIAKDLQKNPYQSVASLVQKLKKVPPQELDNYKSFWREQDIQIMKEEVTRIGKLQILWAKNRYKALKAQPAASVQDLVKEKLLDRAPLDYVSGRQLPL